MHLKSFSTGAARLMHQSGACAPKWCMCSKVVRTKTVHKTKIQWSLEATVVFLQQNFGASKCE
jgi:hypothetical protein